MNLSRKTTYYSFLLLCVGSLSPTGTFPAEFQNGPYKHVIPGDVGVKIGVGVVESTPTDVYTSSTMINVPTVIEHKVINGCLRIDANNVTIRNSIINCGGLYPVHVRNGRSNFIIEYSAINCTSSSKAFYFSSGAPNAMVAHNEISGCQDFFFINGNLNGLQVKNNYMHSLIGSSLAHADGFQIAEGGNSWGDIHIQGNYFDPDNPSIGKTDIIFATGNSAVDINFEDNYMEPWGHYTLRCHGDTQCTIRNNVFSQAFNGIRQNMLLSNSSKPAIFSCNRYANSELVEEYYNGQDLVHGAEHVSDNCPGFHVATSFIISPVLILLLDSTDE